MIEININIHTPKEPQKKAFEEWICRKFKVNDVNDLKLTNSEYCTYMDCWESAIKFREEQLVDRMSVQGFVSEETKKMRDKLNRISAVCDIALDAGTNWDEEQLDDFFEQVKRIVKSI